LFLHGFDYEFIKIYKVIIAARVQHEIDSFIARSEPTTSFCGAAAKGLQQVDTRNKQQQKLAIMYLKCLQLLQVAVPEVAGISLRLISIN